MADLDPELIKNYIQSIRSELLPHQNIENSKDDYIGCHLRLAQNYYYLDDLKKAFYHLTECHGTLLRRYGLLEHLDREGWLKSSSIKWEYLSSTSPEAKEEDVGLYKRLSLMPSEWTVVQLSRILQDGESTLPVDSFPKLKDMFLSRMQCGPDPDDLLVTYNDSSLIPQGDIIVDINQAAKDLLSKGFSAYSVRRRKKASLKIKAIIDKLDDSLFMDWKCLFMGKLEDSLLQHQIKVEIETVFNKYNVTLSRKLMGLYYLMAEAVEFYEPGLIRSSLEKNLPDNKDLKKDLMKKFLSLLETYPQLRGARRHPVILIVDDHLDIVPWESMPILRDQPVTRMSSVHFLYALFKVHEKNINKGLREIKENKVNFYVLNPDGNLPQAEARLKPFFQARLKSWRGYVGTRPSNKQVLDGLSKCNTYIYCGHGSGCHIVYPFDVQKLDLKNSVQVLFGCNSASLKYLGGSVPLTGPMVHYCIAGSACSVGMLYVVLSNSADAMTVELINLWLPGDPIDSKSLEPMKRFSKEPELLRVVAKLRMLPTEIFTNRCGFISRGLPVKLVPA